MLDVKDPTVSRHSAHRWRQGCQPPRRPRFIPRRVTFVHECVRSQSVCIFSVPDRWRSSSTASAHHPIAGFVPPGGLLSGRGQFFGEGNGEAGIEVGTDND
jgi:hypothetical protein